MIRCFHRIDPVDMPGLDRYWADAASIGPVPAQFWHMMVCLQVRDQALHCLNYLNYDLGYSIIKTYTIFKCQIINYMTKIFVYLCRINIIPADGLAMKTAHASHAG